MRLRKKAAIILWGLFVLLGAFAGIMGLWWLLANAAHQGIPPGLNPWGGDL